MPNTPSVIIRSLSALHDQIRTKGHLREAVVIGVDLRGSADLLARTEIGGTTLLGCSLPAQLLESLTLAGATVFPTLTGLPYHAYRASLYTPDELLKGCDPSDVGSFWESSYDARIYAHFERTRRGPPVLEALAQRLHDHSIDTATEELLEDVTLKPIAIMGGHALSRSSAGYRKVTLLARALARAGYFLVSGGGPGAMEATNLGAYCADADDSELQWALATLSGAPHYRDRGWFETALRVRDRIESAVRSLAIPTWFYGHEPTNLFASHVAKYFSNSLREDTLLALALYGVIFTPGSAGTVQEVFMDATQNHYGTFTFVSPMVFLGRDYWLRERPVQPLLQSLAKGRQYADSIAYVDRVEEAVEFLQAHPPVPWQQPARYGSAPG